MPVSEWVWVLCIIKKPELQKEADNVLKQIIMELEKSIISPHVKKLDFLFETFVRL